MTSTSTGATCLIDGRPDDRVAVSDRGLNYGDGLFETVAVTDGRPRLWDRHVQRLVGGCRRLGITPPDADLLHREVGEVAGKRARAVVKIVLTRGAGGRGYRPNPENLPTRIVTGHPWPEWPGNPAAEGVAVRWCRSRLGVNPTLAGLKHLNRLEQVLARAEWDDPEIAEGLMSNVSGDVIEGTMANLFMVRDGVLHTPDLSTAGVAGVVRGLILEGAESLGLQCRVGRYRPQEVAAADELFLTNSLIGIWPIRQVEGQQFPLGTVTQRVIRLLEERF